MEVVSVKRLSTLGFLLVFLATYGTGGFNRAYGAKENPCPGSTPNGEAMKLYPCLDATKDDKVEVPATCCKAVNAVLAKSPICLCAVVLSPAAKMSGVNVSVALTIPKRCNIAKRPIGSKCGDYTLP